MDSGPKPLTVISSFLVNEPANQYRSRLQYMRNFWARILGQTELPARLSVQWCIRFALASKTGYPVAI
jgi:hypothetical protein